MKIDVAPPRMRSTFTTPSQLVADMEIADERYERSERNGQHADVEHCQSSRVIDALRRP